EFDTVQRLAMAGSVIDDSRRTQSPEVYRRLGKPVPGRKPVKVVGEWLGIRRGIQPAKPAPCLHECFREAIVLSEPPAVAGGPFPTSLNLFEPERARP